MQGYILKVTKVRDEDLIVEILTSSDLIRAYRFYGTRHSKISQGYKLDFELEPNPNFLPLIKNTMHLGFKWLLDRDRLFYWQGFIRLLYAHLKGLDSVDSFYFEILEECSKKLEKQNPKRLFLEAYLKILEFEGRLHHLNFCFLCDEEIKNSENIALARAFLPAHERCLNQKGFVRKDLLELFSCKKALNLSDEMVENLYQIITLGL